MSRFTGFSEKSFFLKKRKNRKYGQSMGSDAIPLNFLKGLDSNVIGNDCSMSIFERLDY